MSSLGYLNIYNCELKRLEIGEAVMAKCTNSSISFILKLLLFVLKNNMKSSLIGRLGVKTLFEVNHFISMSIYSISIYEQDY